MKTSKPSSENIRTADNNKSLTRYQELIHCLHKNATWELLKFSMEGVQQIAGDILYVVEVMEESWTSDFRDEDSEYFDSEFRAIKYHLRRSIARITELKVLREGIAELKKISQRIIELKEISKCIAKENYPSIDEEYYKIVDRICNCLFTIEDHRQYSNIIIRNGQFVLNDKVLVDA